MKNILVLEDDAANLKAFAALLWSSGHHVIEASTAREALNAAGRSDQLDLLVSDVALKGDRKSGTELATALLDSHGNLPILFVTGTPMDFWDEADRRNLRALRSKTRVAMLEKPFMPSAFESAVERLLQPNTIADAINGGAPAIAARLVSGIEMTAARKT
jgi:CheY-like chemotaxis protein